MKLVDFCPAAASARRIASLETRITSVQALMAEAAAHAPRIDMVMMERLHRLYLDLALEADTERSTLARADIRSVQGALATLLAAIRDARVADDAESRRAKRLEAGARRFLNDAGFLDGEMAAHLSQTQTSVVKTGDAPPSSGRRTGDAEASGVYAPAI